MEILKKYIKIRKIAKLATKINRISCEVSLVRNDREVLAVKRKLISYHIFNKSETNLKSFLQVTEGRYRIDYAELENMCSQMEKLEESFLISKKSRELSDKLFGEVPRYMYGILLCLSSEVYITFLEMGCTMILSIICFFVYYTIK